MKFHPAKTNGDPITLAIMLLVEMIIIIPVILLIYILIT
jgi:uncharacterized RDD family membrane protein YckC